MKKLYPRVLFVLLFFLSKTAFSQTCDSIKSIWVSYESLCMATGSIKVTTTGGSGFYKYKVNGPVSTSFTSTDSITGLSAGVYTLIVNDFLLNCNDTVTNITVAGNYRDPRFVLRKRNITCEGINNGTITVDSIQFGRPPFSFSIIAPSPMGVGTTNATGIFNNLGVGTYSIQLRDSCGGVQTRTINISNYTWSLFAYPFTRIGCNQYTGQIEVRDILGRNSLVAPGLGGFTYGIIRAPGDTIQSASPYFSFTHLPNTSFQVFAKDSCGTMKRATVSIIQTPSLGASVAISNPVCSTFTASVQAVQNFTSPQYCLTTTSGVVITCNNTGVFNNVPYGNYCIRAYDSCTNTTINRCFSAAPPPASVDAGVTISDRLCTGFTATITGQQNIYSPEYCLYTVSNTLITCNSTGVFTNIPYGIYCIRTRDLCRDTTILRCFNVQRPTPVIIGVTTTNTTCSTMSVTVTADTVYNGQFCLYTNAGVLITCNSTGTFNNVPAGDYCVTVWDACLDTTLRRCFTVSAPPIVNDLVLDIRNRACSTITINASSTLGGAPFCLYDSLGVLVACNSTGVFNNLPYGYYCVTTKVNCPDTLFRTCINAVKLIPSVNASVQISNRNCNSFTATITGQTNLVNPQFCLYNSANVLLSCNSTGVFNNLPYGSYCITLTMPCYDTTISRCFTRNIPTVNLDVDDDRSCNLGMTDYELDVSGGFSPYTVVVLNPNQTVRFSGTFTSNNFNINNLPGLVSPLRYTFIVADACGRADTVLLGAPSWNFTRSVNVQKRCPGAVWQTGSGDIFQTVTTNMSGASVRIIKKNGVALSPFVAPTLASATLFSFLDQGPGTYILRTTETSCGNYYYDTVTIAPYEYPVLNNTRAFQCDVNGFSIATAVTKGVAPYMYEIIGSTPSLPSLITAPQASPSFSINNGQSYSLVRLRVIDACGNASLGDASILPLAFTGIRSTNYCLMYPTTLTVDNITGATYRWYRKRNLSATDSVFLGNTSSYYIPSLMYADTGMYICYLSINAGCVNRVFNHRINGSCFSFLPVELLEFSGKTVSRENVLKWRVKAEREVRFYVVERKNGNDDFTEIARVAAKNEIGKIQEYGFTDFNPSPGENMYRLRIIYMNENTGYTEVVTLSNNDTHSFQIYPNPAKQVVHIEFNNTVKKSYSLRLINAAGGEVYTADIVSQPGSIYRLNRNKNIASGFYMLQLIDKASNSVQTVKMIFL